MNQADNGGTRRGVYCVLSARSLPYASKAMESLVAHSVDSLDLTLITDSAADRDALQEAMQALDVPARHEWRVYEQQDADERADALLESFPHVAAFRFGHPCWRKITDPLLFAPHNAEMVILDPDLYFPNHFSFEPTPPAGLLLMHQPPSCLLPHEVVLRAYDNGIQLAHHVDIGVAQTRNALDLEWLDWLIERLGGKSLPRAMHVEAIVWAALAMRIGGGYLDPEQWHCWQNSQWKRLALRLGVTGRTLLRAENFVRMKCFHGGGIAKWWVPVALAAGDFPKPRTVFDSKPAMPFENLTREAYEATQRMKAWARRAGYYRFIKPSS